MQHRITINLHGSKSGTAPGAMPSKHERGIVSGWSPKAARRNTEFLQTVDYDGLPSIGMAFTGTIKDCPPTSDDWHALRNAFIRRLKRLGMILHHYVTEWQRRGIPHLHGMFFFESATPNGKILPIAVQEAWLAVSAPYGSTSRGVHMAPLTDRLGWAQYEAKHAARGVNHYQRCKENIPPAWLGKTGRVWGKGGDWPTQSSMVMATSGPVFWRFRRLVRSWRISSARASGNARRIAYARQCLKCTNPKLSAVRGTTDWIPLPDSLSLLHAAAVLSGGEVDQIS